MKIMIQTTDGPRETTAHETCVHGLVVNRGYNARPRGWVVTHLRTGRILPWLFPTLASARESVRRTRDRSRDAGVHTRWGSRRGFSGDHAAWAKLFRVVAMHNGARPCE